MNSTMKNTTGERITIAAGVAILAVATWFAARTPTVAPLPNTATASSSASAATAAASTSAIVPIAVTGPSIKSQNPPVVITLTSPTSGAQWTIGQQNNIIWNKAAGVTGQLYLVDAKTGAIAGWIQQSIASTQTYFPWNTRELFSSATSPQGKDVLPGEYVVKISFTSPNIPSAVSAPFFIN